MEKIPDGTFETVLACPVCGSDQILYTERYPHISAYCKECGQFIKHVAQYTSDENWNRAIKERDQYTCQRCGKRLVGRAAHAHHKMPAWFMPKLKFDLKNGICLCNECHKQLHGHGGTIRDDDDSQENSA